MTAMPVAITDTTGQAPVSTVDRKRTWPTVVVWILVGPFAWWAAWRMFGLEFGFPGVAAMSYTPYVAAASILPLGLAIVARRWKATAVAALTVVLFATMVLPRAFSDARPDSALGGPELRVMTMNMYFGGADAAGIVDLARRERVDLLSLQELTPAALTRLDEAGLADLLPYRVATPAGGASGSGIFSIHPLDELSLGQESRGLAAPMAGLTVSGVRVEVVAVHPYPPSSAGNMQRWADGLEELPGARSDDVIRILAGDFNATLDHALLRTLVGEGYRDAAASLGEGLTGTWPANGAHAMPPVAIDHVLADERCAVESVSVVTVAGSDHRAVLANLTLPRR